MSYRLSDRGRTGVYRIAIAEQGGPRVGRYETADEAMIVVNWLRSASSGEFTIYGPTGAVVSEADLAVAAVEASLKAMGVKVSRI